MFKPIFNRKINSDYNSTTINIGLKTLRGRLYSGSAVILIRNQTYSENVYGCII